MVGRTVDKQALRRAATRSRIVTAGTRLFEDEGYNRTSMRDISTSAGVAQRTIYLHFESKAAILLAYFDDWLDAYVDALCRRPPHEAIDDMMIAAFSALNEDGQIDNRTFDQMEVLHPSLEILTSNNREITGHAMHSWVAAQDRLSDHLRQHGSTPLEARVRSAAVFATWMATLLTYQDQLQGSKSGGPLHEVAIDVIRSFGAGLNDHVGQREDDVMSRSQ